MTEAHHRYREARRKVYGGLPEGWGYIWIAAVLAIPVMIWDGIKRLAGGRGHRHGDAGGVP